MAYEVDFLPVGKGEKSGDAIAMRFWDLSRPDNQIVIVIDGGFGKETGKQLVDLIRGYYGVNRVDLVVSTHPDLDHIGGLETVLDEFGNQVERLAMHLPWKHNQAVFNMIDDGRATSASVRTNLRDSLKAAVSLEKKARTLGILIEEPFAGKGWRMPGGGEVRVVGPTKNFYKFLLPQFDGMPKYSGNAPYPSVGFAPPLLYIPTQDRWEPGFPSLSDSSQTSAKNDSSVILQVTVENRRLLFTGDAGTVALRHAADYLIANRAHSVPLRMIQIPHHGSRSNIGPDVLNDIVGPVMPLNYQKEDVRAIVSCAPDGFPEHPHDRVLNEFTKRGVRCFKTCGYGFCHFFGVGYRAGYSPIAPYQFRETVTEC